MVMKAAITISVPHFQKNGRVNGNGILSDFSLPNPLPNRVVFGSLFVHEVLRCQIHGQTHIDLYADLVVGHRRRLIPNKTTHKRPAGEGGPWNDQLTISLSLEFEVIVCDVEVLYRLGSRTCDSCVECSACRNCT